MASIYKFYATPTDISPNFVVADDIESAIELWQRDWKGGLTGHCEPDRIERVSSGHHVIVEPITSPASGGDIPKEGE